MNRISCLLIVYCALLATTLYSRNHNQLKHFNNRLMVHCFDCDRKSLRVIDAFETSYSSYIAISEDNQGKKIVIKQEMRNKAYALLVVVREKTSAFIAQSVDVLVNNVEIIPMNYDFIGKRDRSKPATLHTFVPGVLAKFLPKPLKLITFIQQPAKLIVPKDKWGLTREVIQNMARHPDLCKIVAFDTFMGNADRHRGNLIYDSSADRFIAIDLESILKRDLAIYSCNCIKSMIDNPEESITQEELSGLRIYRNILKQLVKLHSPETVYQKMIEFAQEGGLMTTGLESSVRKTLKKYKKNMDLNYASCQKLIVLLNQLIAQHSRHKKR